MLLLFVTIVFFFLSVFASLLLSLAIHLVFSRFAPSTMILMFSIPRLRTYLDITLHPDLRMCVPLVLIYLFILCLVVVGAAAVDYAAAADAGVLFC